MSTHATLGFYGGVGSVTGANFLLDTGEAAFLVDCGLIQGERFHTGANADQFPYEPEAIDVLLVTHAHADHIGRIPKLVRDGFAGTIYSTEPTKDIAALMLRDAYRIMLYEEEKYGTARLYGEKDINDTLELWRTVAYHTPVSLPDGVTARFFNAGHILGSASVHLDRRGKTIVFSGDIGNIPQPLLDAPEFPEGYDYLVMESVYGDRLHEGVTERTNMLAKEIEAARLRGGTLVIPAFSLERTQGIVLEINNLVESGTIAPISTYLDSPLAIAVTDVYRTYPEYLSETIRAQIVAGDDIFAFPKFTVTRSVADSREIAKAGGAKIIIAGSGMSHGGRILEHERRYLEDPKTTLLLVGYQAVGSLGRRLQDGAKRVRIDDTDVKVRAKIATISGYSGHADRDQLINYVAHGGEKAKTVFVTMGEERSALFLTQRLRDYLGVHAVAPEANEEIEIDF